MKFLFSASVIALSFALTGPDAAASAIYASFDSPGVQTIDVYPLQPNVFGTRIIPTTNASGLAIAGQKLYWQDGNGIYESNLDGSGVQVLNGFGVTPTSFAVNPAAATIYVSFDSPNVQTIDIYPLTPNVFGTRIIPTTASTSLSVAGNKLYWLDGNAIYEANLDGSGVQVLNSFGVTPTSFVVDAANAEIYASFDSPGVQTIDIYPLAPNVFGRRIIPTTSAFDLSIANGKLYWLDGDSIYDANLDGSNVQILNSFGVPPTSIAVYDPVVVPAPEPASIAMFLAGFSIISMIRGRWATAG